MSKTSKYKKTRISEADSPAESDLAGRIRMLEAELENNRRELEIERALDAVRRIAMSMKKPEDMLQICRVISKELEKLDVKEIRNVQTAVIYEEIHAYKNYVYYRLDDAEVIQEVDYLLQKDVNDFANKMLEGTEEFYTTSFDKAKVKDYLRYQTASNLYADRHLMNADSLNFYFYSIGSGALGLSTYAPLSEEMVTNFKRFRNVFELAYRRFADIEQAQKQAREAQIEAALERVRTVAMSMARSEELLKVCETVFRELRSLGFTDALLRNTQIVINNDEKEFYNSYQYSDLLGGEITEVSYDMHPIIRKLNEKLRRSTDAFADVEISGKELEDWKQFVRSFPQKHDETLFEARELHYYFYSVGIGALGISTFRSLGNEELRIIQRFRNVFDLSYKRYNDIKQTEVQAREARIEAALERVRARAVAMHSSDELIEASDVFFEQLTHLGIETIRTGVGIFDADNGTVEVWSRAYTGEDSEHKILGTVPRSINKFFEGCFDAWRNKEPYFVSGFKGKEVKEFYVSMKNVLSYPEGTGFNDEEHFSLFYFPEGSLNVVSKQKLTEDELYILVRFAAVFGLMYRRFLDLKKAEEQTREANIETSLERVRAAAMSMMKPEDLLNVCETLYREFQRLGFDELRNAMINIHNDEKSTFINYDYSNEIGRSITPLYYDIHPVISKQIKEIRKANDAFSETIFEGKDLEGWIEFRRSRGEKDDPRINALTSLHYYFYSIGNGSIGISTFSPISSEKLVLLKRFRNVFSLSYRRYTDIALAEAQAREARIEVSLERVRAKAMAMHSTDDFNDAVAVVFEELDKLDLAIQRCGIGIIDKDSKSVNVYTASVSEHDTVLKVSGNENMDIHPLLQGAYAGWLNQKDFSYVLQGDDLARYYEAVGKSDFKLPESQTAVAHHKDATQYYFVTPFEEGGLFAFRDSEFTDEARSVLKRFAGVFNLTYKRFLDLQKAEAQAQKAQIETALERVRARALAMQQPEELNEVEFVLRQEMGALGVNEIETCSIYIHDENTSNAECRYAIRDNRNYDSKLTADQFALDLSDTWVGNEMLKFYRSDAKHTSIVMQGENRREWVKYCERKSVPFRGYYGEDIPDRVYHLFRFSHGTVGTVTEGDISEGHTDLLQRIASVFSLAYSRYRDLTQARTDLQNLKEEKKRSESLLLNILPEEIANELKQFGKSYARKHEEVTILYADIKGFTAIAETLSAQELVTQLDECFRAFDKIVDKHGLEKIRTIGDAYVCACGLPKPVPDNAVRTVRAALDMITFIKGFAMTRQIQDLPAFEFRIGIHTGPVITGVVGLKKFTYDIWGDSVTMAARMEQHGEAGKINISGSTYELVKDKFTCTHRGKIEAKNKGEVDMYFVEG